MNTYDPYHRVEYRHLGVPTPADDVVNRIDPSERPAVPPSRR